MTGFANSKVTALIRSAGCARCIEALLCAQGLRTEFAESIVDVVRALRKAQARAVVLEDKGPELLDWLEAIKLQAPGTAAILVVGSSAGADLAGILARGASDYADYSELDSQFAAKLRARMGSSEHADLALAVGPYVLCQETCTLSSNTGVEVSLTKREFSLAQILFARVGRAVSTAVIYQHLWGLSRDISKRMLEEHVSNLRRKLSRQGCLDVQIRAVFGTGYRLDIEPAQREPDVRYG